MYALTLNDYVINSLSVSVLYIVKHFASMLGTELQCIAFDLKTKFDISIPIFLSVAMMPITCLMPQR